MYKRLLNPLKTKSFFLFGARGTGKTTCLRDLFDRSEVLWIDLLNDRDFIQYGREPGLVFDGAKTRAKANPSQTVWIIIDEVQRIPKLLNEVHRTLEDPEVGSRIKFALTGSSARKLKRGSANLLGGRALVNNLYPLTHREIGGGFNINTVLNWGSLPAVINEHDSLTRAELLESYFATYLREEIREEQIIRKLDPFNRFLEVAAQTSGEIVNYSATARECQGDSAAVARYYQVLEDTLIGTFLSSYDRSVRQQQAKSPKFYLFDLGVQRALRGTLNVPITPSSYGYGKVFEQFFVLEAIRLNSYLRKRFKFYYLRTKDNAEVDLIIERPGDETVLIEIKSSANPTAHDTRHVKTFSREIRNSKAWLVSQDEKERVSDGVRFLSWKMALDELFDSD